METIPFSYAYVTPGLHGLSYAYVYARAYAYMYMYVVLISYAGALRDEPKSEFDWIKQTVLFFLNWTAGLFLKELPM